MVVQHIKVNLSIRASSRASRHGEMRFSDVAATLIAVKFSIRQLVRGCRKPRNNFSGSFIGGHDPSPLGLDAIADGKMGHHNLPPSTDEIMLLCRQT